MTGTRAPVLRMNAVSKRFGEVTANDYVSLDVYAGEVHCLLGENGAGKSTLIAMLAGMLAPDEGSIDIGGAEVQLTPAAALSRGIGVVYQHSTLIPDLTVIENVMLLGGKRTQLWLRRAAATKRLSELAALLETSFEPDMLAGRLSLAQQQQLEVIKALWLDARVLLLDEPTSLMPSTAAAALLKSVRRLAESGIAVIFVSHKLDEVLGVADRCTVLRAGRVVLSATARGGDKDSLRRRLLSAMFGSELDASEAVDGEDEVRTEDSAKRGVASSLPAVVSRSGVSPAADPPAKPTTGPTASPAAEQTETLTAAPLLALDRVTTHPKGLAQASQQGTPLVDVSLEVHAGEVLGIAGIEGQGQKSLAEVIAGQVVPVAGRVYVDGVDITRTSLDARWQLGIRYVTDDRLHEGIIGSMSVAMNLLLKRIGRPPFWQFGFMRREAVRVAATDMIALHEIRTPAPDAPAGQLSGGNIQKILLARELSDGARLVVFDKPGHGLDLRAVHRAHDNIRALAERGAAAVLISSDLDELTLLADRIVVLAGGKNVGEIKSADSQSRERIGDLMVSGSAQP